MMKGKEILFGQDARNALWRGIDQLADVVRITLGPNGKNVGILPSFTSPSITRDGARITQDFETDDPATNAGASMAKEVASKIQETVGDGATTGIVLLHALVEGGIRSIASGANPLSIKRGMDKALKHVLGFIDASSREIKTHQDTTNIATISAQNSEEIGETISSCFQKMGKEGVISIDESKGTEMVIELLEGMQLDRGFATPSFITNHEKMRAELENPFVLVTDRKIISAQEILPILQFVSKKGASLFIIAEEIDGDALSTLILNKLKGTLKVAAMNVPGFGAEKKGLLQDVAILTGSTLITEDEGRLLRDADASILGSAEQITLSKNSTTIIGGKGKREEIKSHIDLLNGEIKRATSSFEKENLLKRKGTLEGGVAVIRVGALTDTLLKKKKQLFEDSLRATRSALEEGIIPGGGLILLHAGSVEKNIPLDPEEAVGAALLFKACEAPFRQLVENSGYDPSITLLEVQSLGNMCGFNASNGNIENLPKAGVVDPVSVVKGALTHAVSMASIILLTESIISPEQD